MGLVNQFLESDCYHVGQHGPSSQGQIVSSSSWYLPYDVFWLEALIDSHGRGSDPQRGRLGAYRPQKIDNSNSLAVSLIGTPKITTTSASYTYPSIE